MESIGAFILLVLFMGFSVTADSSHSSDAKLLLALKAGIYDYNGYLDSWSENNSGHHCFWVGVQCDRSNHIVSLDFSNMNHSGVIPDLLKFQTFYCFLFGSE